MMSQTDMPQDADKTKLFVGNLPFSMTEEGLNDLLTQYGEIVELNYIVNKLTGRFKGFAFVKYATEKAAQDAIAGLEGQEVEGRPLVINVARPMRPRTFDRNDRGGRSYGNRGRDDRRGSYSRGDRN